MNQKSFEICRMSKNLLHKKYNEEKGKKSRGAPYFFNTLGANNEVCSTAREVQIEKRSVSAETQSAETAKKQFRLEETGFLQRRKIKCNELEHSLK